MIGRYLCVETQLIFIFSLTLTQTILKIFTQDNIEQQHYHIKFFYMFLKMLTPDLW